MLGGGYADRSEIEQRHDVVTYTSRPLEAPLELAGPVTVKLQVSSSAPDTDFVAVLSEVDPEGRSVNITHGVARMRYRDGLDHPRLMEPGNIYEASIDLWHTAIELQAGRRIRLAVSSSYFPVFDRNLNTGGDNFTDTEFQVAVNTIHHGGPRPSALILPVLETK